MSLRGIGAAFRFEWRRSVRPSQLLLAAALILFPLGLAALIRREEPSAFRQLDQIYVFVYALIIRIASPLALLLWAAPAVHSEIEARTWTYLAVRPNGRSSVLLGKYLAAVVWATLVGVSALALCLLGIGMRNRFTADLLHLGPIVFFSCAAYGALYLLLGVAFIKRAMVISVSYTLVIEVLLTLVPAVVNRITIDFRLRSILCSGLDLSRMPREFEVFVSRAEPSHQMAILAAYSLALLVAAVLLLRGKELVLAED